VGGNLAVSLRQATSVYCITFFMVKTLESYSVYKLLILLLLQYISISSFGKYIIIPIHRNTSIRFDFKILMVATNSNHRIAYALSILNQNKLKTTL